MSRFEEYTQVSQNAMLVQGEILTFDPLEDDPFSLFGKTTPERDDVAFLKSLGLGKPHIERYTARAQRNGSSFEAELLADGLVTEDAYFGAFARFLRLPFSAELDGAIVVDTPSLDIQLLETRMVRLSPADAKPYIAVTPDIESIERLKAALDTRPMVAADLIVTTPSALRKAVWTAGAERRTRQTINALFEATPLYSARITLHGKQGFLLGMCAACLVGSMLLSPALTFQLLHIVTAALYMAAVLFRLVPKRDEPFRRNLTVIEQSNDEQLPVYTILVALYREEAVAEQLINALDRLDWPKSRLDIKLVCEADDATTIDAIIRLNPGYHIELVRVPPSLPRTKPKALTYALSGARGEFIAIYDAEDRPHPKQLREAYARFRTGTDQLACLQAPLIISNANASWITSSFSLEYSALFRRMLPMLARMKMPLPLGGTSNHFRTAILRKVGAWDPYNVTEDADLGLRLHRLGYQSDVISYQTLEDAPTDIFVWLNQRSRWFKGWLQSWLVMMRSPVAISKEMGWKAYLVFHLLIGGMLLSSLTHPLFILYVLYIGHIIWTEGMAALSASQLVMFSIDMLNIVASYTIFLLMGRRAMIPHERKLVGKRWLYTPLYWLMLSVAAWRALYELRYKPFVWNKTPHKPRSRNN
ncbi:glycosyltransferase [Agrobacterium rubi]|uniref:glycosyltransferase family 2 protein n=1 Tax=Agrobacterium rubi TaxID=28099 RepID=UPI001574636D|nr:glycosyltransferase family 2 protein [Agrobacterium rubi]NTF06383.1 glycosyltransferase [Agrobacterium rubi]NTF18624.1 glycosyltransferase [Agrobacterium rubi]NTF25588.1 glycosyltransferase [Agrobacterium rubi]